MRRMKFRQVTGPAFDNWKSSARSARSTAGWLLLALAVLALGARPAAALVHASILVDAQTGQVLHAYHADSRAHPASLTKLMTLYITFQRLESGELHFDSRLRISRHAAAQQPSRLGLQPGDTISVRYCILGITGHSANDAAVVLAENIAGSELAFVHLMNQEARRLGMTRTIFYNANGLPNDRQWTTARDMSKLALAIIRTYPQYYHFFDTPSFRFHGRTIYGYDHLLDEYAGVDGMKTGYIRSSGFNVVTSAVHDHRRLVGVVLGGITARSRDRQMIALMNSGFATHSTRRMLEARASAPPASVHRVHPAAELVSTDDGDPVLPEQSDWVIQIGGRFRSEYSVRRVLHSARISLPHSLREGRPLVVRLRGRRYRARFSGLSHEEALRVCSALDRRGFMCRLLMHTPARIQDVASADTVSSVAQSE